MTRKNPWLRASLIVCLVNLIVGNGLIIFALNYKPYGLGGVFNAAVYYFTILGMAAMGVVGALLAFISIIKFRVNSGVLLILLLNLLIGFLPLVYEKHEQLQRRTAIMHSIVMGSENFCGQTEQCEQDIR